MSKRARRRRRGRAREWRWIQTFIDMAEMIHATRKLTDALEALTIPIGIGL